MPLNYERIYAGIIHIRMNKPALYTLIFYSMQIWTHV